MKSSFLIIVSIYLYVSPALATMPFFFYSDAAEEAQVTYTAIYRSNMTSLRELGSMSYFGKKSFTKHQVMPLLGYLFGPAVYRDLGSPQRAPDLIMHWESAFLNNGLVEIPYTMNSDWILKKRISEKKYFDLPVPYNQSSLFTEDWLDCTDSAPDHQIPSFFWYFWDPARYACDHELNVQYQTVRFEVISTTPQQKTSFPEYSRLINDRELQMTFALGYVETPDSPDPETDDDLGMSEYRSFLKSTKEFLDFDYKETLILQKEYRTSINDKAVIGHRLSGQRNGINITINIVTAGDIDQMEIFSKSFAHDHDDFFAWMGHSRLGAGFDADHLTYRLKQHPEYYDISDKYQLVYWGGCNSYSYYTLPFFNFKQAYFPASDPLGTQNLDIIANGLPSYFSLNATNANILLESVVQWEKKNSFQSIIDNLEWQASGMGIAPLAAVLGDEDNPL